MLIFAHRGASAIAPENTLLSIQTAIDSNVDGIEIDIFEIDGQLLVIHDRWLERTTSGSGLLTQHSFADLRQLDAGKGQKIPTLDEVLAIMPKHCLLNIELKGINNIELLLQCIDQGVLKYNITTKQLLLSSFNHHQLYAITQQRPELAIGALTASLPLTYATFATALNAYSVHISIDTISKDFVLDAHQRGLQVYVYTVDRLEDIYLLTSLGVDGIFANNPKQARLYMDNIQADMT
ncbi:glycerophosphodiester phosphodiesterase [Colwellia ponticola]|uniref:Glycerophosphodiester phosphodiesterase n=1 Tax=Colwellia ponticola TaxID=2304625 RepID=A0A8H2JP02_9GAMM|nr:glycerophosphodiester phosphodiesterase family protein [Colwellia ponticola]TMM45015.1 glycerophosphodiester phosphodiesterase [Colwellia ponticola]